MNVERLIRMILRRFLRKGINKGVDMAARRGKADADMTPEERAQAKAASQNAKKLQKGMRATRRIMK